MTTPAHLDSWFTFYPPTDDQVGQYSEISESAKALARVIIAASPAGADQMAAIRLLRECTVSALTQFYKRCS